MKQSLILAYFTLISKTKSLSSKDWAKGIDYPLQLKIDRIKHILSTRYNCSPEEL